MTFELLLIALHILLAIVIFGPLLTFGVVLPIWIRKGPEMAKPVEAVTKMLDHMGRATPLVFLLGIFIVMKDKSIEFSDGWIGASMGLFIVAIINGMGFIKPTAAKAAAKLLAGDNADAEASKLRALTTFAAVLVIAILWLMVKKPGA